MRGNPFLWIIDGDYIACFGMFKMGWINARAITQRHILDTEVTLAAALRGWQAVKLSVFEKLYMAFGA